MISVVLFGHGALAALCLVAGAFPKPIRIRLTPAVALLGAALGGLQVALWGSGEGWRTVSLDPAGAPIAGAAAVAAWAIVATSGPAEERWWSGAFVGVSAMGLGMFASNDWLVPALLFWSVSSIALIALLVRAKGGIAPVTAIVVSDALLIAAAAQGVLGDGNWTLPKGSGDGWFWLLAAAAIVRTGTIPLLAPGSARASLPLLAGGGLSIAVGIGQGSEPWLAAALVATAVLWAVLASTRRAPSIALPCATLAAVGLATIYAGAGAGGAAGIAVALGTGGLVLARASAGTALLVALVPLTPGFSALAAAAEVSFRGATEAPGTVASAPWTALAALLPVALAAAVAIGGRVLRSRGVDEDRSSRIAAAVLVAGAIVAGIAGIGARGDAGGDPLVLASALGAGCLAGAVSALRGRHLPVIGPEPFVVPTPHMLGGRSARFAVVVLALVVLAELSTVALVTIEGLRTGFL